jgi:two-component sensor histidine kinase
LNENVRNRRKVGLPLVNLILFTLVAIALVGAVVLIFNTIEAERQTREQARETGKIVLELRNIGRIATNAETGQRGYFITLDQRYLDPYRAAREQYQPAIDRLKALVGSDPTPRQAQLMAEIERLGRARFADLELSVAQIERGELIAAQRQILTDEGQETMSRLRRSLTEMELIENRILASANEVTTRVEARVLPMLAGLLVLLLAALGLGYWQVARAARTAALELHAQELAEAHEQAELLARELNHRVKNLFAVVLAIVRMSGKSDPRAKDVVENIAQRIHALLTAHEVTQGTLGNQQADLRQLIETTLAPHDGSEVELELQGPNIALPAKQVTPLGLVFHELATNAVKYGAWSQGGTIEVSWTVSESEIVLEWSEHCPTGCPVAGHKGFGTQLIDSAARQLQGRIERDFTPDGVHVTIAFPAGTA